MYPFNTVNLASIDKKLSFFGGEHMACTTLYQFVDFGNVEETNIIVGNVTQCTKISNPCVLCEQLEGFSIHGTSHTSPCRHFNILHEPSLFFLFYSPKSTNITSNCHHYHQQPFLLFFFIFLNIPIFNLMHFLLTINTITIKTWMYLVTGLVTVLTTLTTPLFLLIITS